MKPGDASARRRRKPGSAASPHREGRREARRQVVLVLQGGGALGAYQAGVYEGLHEAGMEPDWVIGTSIGAVNAALIVGNPPSKRIERLRAFWDAVAQKGPAAIWPGPPGLPTAWTTWSALSFGLPRFFSPYARAWLSPHLPLAEDACGFYQTTPLFDTLSGLVDCTLLGGCAPRMTVGAVNVRTGRLHYFDSRDGPLDLRHVMASGALPPAFPPVAIGSELYWDGGIYSNTPVEAVFDDHPRRDALVFAVQLWRPAGEAPRSMWQVGGRQKDIQYASRVDSHVQRQAQIHRLRHIVRELAHRLPAEVRRLHEVREMEAYGCGTVMHLMRLVAPRLPDEDHTKDLDFHVARIDQRRQAGLADARRALAARPWLAPVDPVEGLVVHDLPG